MKIKLVISFLKLLIDQSPVILGTRTVQSDVAGLPYRLNSSDFRWLPTYIQAARLAGRANPNQHARLRPHHLQAAPSGDLRAR
jgi:hypothetical protein